MAIFRLSKGFQLTTPHRRSAIIHIGFAREINPFSFGPENTICQPRLTIMRGPVLYLSPS